jgi:hypothetical protein
LGLTCKGEMDDNINTLDATELGMSVRISMLLLLHLMLPIANPTGRSACIASHHGSPLFCIYIYIYIDADFLTAWLAVHRPTAVGYREHAC